MGRLVKATLFTVLFMVFGSHSYAALYFGTGTLSGLFEDLAHNAYNFSYAGSMRLDFDTKVVAQPMPAPPRVDVFLTLETLGQGMWEEAGPPPTTSGTAKASLTTLGFVMPYAGGSGGPGEMYAPLVSSIAGVSVAGTNVFFPTWTVMGDQIVLTGSVADDVLITDIRFSFEGTAVPEPTSLFLFGIGLIGIAGTKRFRRQ